MRPSPGLVIVLAVMLPAASRLVEAIVRAWLEARARGPADALVVYEACLVLVLFSFGLVIGHQWAAALTFLGGAALAAYMQKRNLRPTPPTPPTPHSATGPNNSRSV